MTGRGITFISSAVNEAFIQIQVIHGIKCCYLRDTVYVTGVFMKDFKRVPDLS